MTLILLSSCSSTLRETANRYNLLADNTLQIHAYEAVESFLFTHKLKTAQFQVHGFTRIDTIVLHEPGRHLEIRMSKQLGYFPVREPSVEAIYNALKHHLGGRFSGWNVSLWAGKYEFSDLVPNYYRRSSLLPDPSRKFPSPEGTIPLVRRLSDAPSPHSGLYGKHIALWPSHGYYYEPGFDRWEWQRARVFGTVEDLLPMSFILPYLAPMLENAGANVLLPRERDTQINEVIVDADFLDQGSYEEVGEADWSTAASPGFGATTTISADSINLFHLGRTRSVLTDTVRSATAIWTPKIPERGSYAVYISYNSDNLAPTDAHYQVRHLGGTTDFLVNQQIGGGTWIYLGHFEFDTGQDSALGAVLLSNKSQIVGQQLSADAIKFGGGMGTVARNGKLSNKPRYAEGARYYMQFAGMPPSLVFNVTDTLHDYRDDYKGRGEWVNYLRGAPLGPYKDREVSGLGIPVDLSLAFHTDAGTTRNDTTIGTLMIYSTRDLDDSRYFPNQVSRLANRDFADILQTQIVDDLAEKYDRSWRRRSLWDSKYSEACTPNVPAALLELLSHHNYLDMKFAHDPRFRFDASRSIYKGILRFLADQSDSPYIVQPLPVSHLAAELDDSGGAVVRWKPVSDPLESSADPEGYMVYSRLEDGGFDNGRYTLSPHFHVPELMDSLIYSFLVRAYNRGGLSMPSEIVSLCKMPNSEETVLVVNGFDRVSGPAVVENSDMLGFADFFDAGVPDGYQFDYIGSQYEFDPDEKWTDDDAPGHGASYADAECTRVAGNTHDFALTHGHAIRAAGYSFTSISDESFETDSSLSSRYKLLDLFLGEEKKTPWPRAENGFQFEAFPTGLQGALASFVESGGAFFISGAYVGSDLIEGKSADHPDRQFAADILKVKWLTDHAGRTGFVSVVDSNFSSTENLQYSAIRNPDIYAVESPDGIIAADSLGHTIYRYHENNVSAGIAWNGYPRRVVLGFPFETIIGEKNRAALMTDVLRFLLDSKDN